MAHSIAYGIGAQSYSNLTAIKNGGIIDYHIVQHGGGVPPNPQFPKDCAAAGVSPILNNGNDGIPGWNGSPSYYQTCAALGYMAAGGESENAAEMDAIMDNLIFMNYGGEGTPGGNNDDVFAVTHPAGVRGHGCASYLETYGSMDNFWSWSVIGNGAVNAKTHGCKEVGILVGNWMINFSSAQNYIDLGQSFESHGITLAGIVVWAGYGSDMNALYNQFAPWFKAWQAVWPADMRTIDKRFGGSAPQPTPQPTPTPPTAGPISFASSPVIADDGSILIVGSDKALWRYSNGMWQSLGGQVKEGTSPATAADVYVVEGTDGKLYRRTLATNWVKVSDRIK